MKWLILIISILLFIEVYTFLGVKSLASGNKYGYVLYIFYALTILLIIAFVVSMRIDFNRGIPMRNSIAKNFFNGFAFTIFITKMVFALVIFAGDFGRFINYIIHVFSSNSVEEFSNGRRKFIAQTGLIIASIPFASFVYGITKGKYNYKINRVKLSFKDLPKAFHGLKVVQISDVHSGSFDDPEEVERGLNMIKELEPDLVLFTGDLVNNVAEEIEPYISMFASINPKLGKYSILGNHDYGDYWKWDSKEDQAKNLIQLEEHHASMGFNLMKNEHTRIEKDGESIVLAGVENWGKPPFHQYGDLNKTLEGVEEKEFTLLMSHDPSHWDEHVLDHKKHVHLTMSGHTHGMQFGIDIPGIKWSPVKYKYPRWSGLYNEKKQNLYVNKGFGFLGFPGRVGMWPEITVFELEHEA